MPCNNFIFFMRKVVFLTFCLLLGHLVSMAEENHFKARIYNNVYDVEIVMNLNEESTTIPGQEILGKVFGYLKKKTDSRVWAIMSAEISKDGKRAGIEMVNDYGSEDLNAELTYDAKTGTYTLRQLSGSTLKVSNGKKWVKLPKELVFEPQR